MVLGGGTTARVSLGHNPGLKEILDKSRKLWKSAPQPQIEPYICKYICQQNTTKDLLNTDQSIVCIENTYLNSPETAFYSPQMNTFQEM